MSTSAGATVRQAAAARPLRRDAQANRQKILAAAAEVFTERGLQASLDDVARRAGVGVGTVYRRFAGKQALADSLFEERIGAVAGLAEAALADPDPWAGLASFLDQAGAMLAGDRGLCDVTLFARCGGEAIRRARARMQPLVTSLVSRAQAAGAVRADLRPTDIRMIVVMLTAVSDYAGNLQPGIWRRYLAIILDGLRPARDSAAPLAVPALTPDALEQAMRMITPGRR